MLPARCTLRVSARRFSARPHGARQGMSLLEVLLSTSLAVVMLAGIYTAMQQSARLTLIGRDSHERGALMRGLVRLVERDLRSIQFHPTPSDTEGEDDGSIGVTESPSTSFLSSGSGSSGSGSGSSGSGTGGSGSGSSGSGSGSGGSSSGSGGTGSGSGANETVESVDSMETLEEQVDSSSWGLRGSATGLQMMVARPQRDWGATITVDNGELPLASSEVKVVEYFLGSAASTTTAAATTTSTGASLASDGLALIRSETDRFQSGAASSTALAEEVTALSVRYFDGTGWVTTWDSASTNSLPRAVELTLQLKPPALQGGVFAVPQPSLPTSVVHVFAIPAAAPLPTLE